MITKASTMLIVENLAAAKQFYVDVLGLQISKEHPNRVYFLVGDHEVVMFQGDGPAIDYKHAYDASSTLIFTVDDLDKKMAELTSHGVRIVHDEVISQPWGRYCAFADPSGIVHEIFEPAESAK